MNKRKTNDITEKCETMKNYLDLVPVSAKRHRCQSRMTRICIILSVFLVAAIFSMADMAIRSQRYQSIQTDGAWHVMFRNISDEKAELLKVRPEVVKSSRYAVTNYSVDMGYQINGKETAICGFDEAFLELYPATKLAKGRFPTAPDEAVVTQSVEKQLGARLGDSITLDTPKGALTFTICGFTGDTSMLTKRDVFGLFISTETYLADFADATFAEDFVVYVEFSPFSNMQKSITNICNDLGIDRDSVTENTKLMGLMLQSKDDFMLKLYMVAAVLAVLVMVAGILMISGSLNSNVAQRTQFFGMLRCVGATKKQIIRFVRREALDWCKTAIPLGLAASIMVVWGLCGLLEFLSPTYFAGMPVFAISWIGLIAGLLMGLITVLLAVRSPAKKAARVSPLTAVSGNAGTVPAARHAAKTRVLRVDTALGVHHAVGSKKNFLLMAGSFAFSIILFLSFSPMIDFMNHAITPLRPYTPDLSIVSPDNTCSVPEALMEEITTHSSVKRAYGRSFAYNLPVQTEGTDTLANLISYESNQFNWGEDYLVEGSMDAAQKGEGVLVNFGKELSIHPGDMITIETPLGKKEAAVSGILSYTPFSRAQDTGTVICSESLFREFTGQTGYTIIDIQLNAGASNIDVDELRALAGDSLSFSDQRMGNNEAKGAYYSFALFVYGFLAVIALISVFSIINSMAMSVSARMKQYGAMRAIGMSSRQLIRMVAAEASTYVIWGILFGLTAGIAINRQLFTWLVTSRWGDAWYLPFGAMTVIIVCVLLSVVWAVYGPARRIREMSIVDTIGAQ